MILKGLLIYLGLQITMVAVVVTAFAGVVVLIGTVVVLVLVGVML